jgi:hypothetical protein
VQVVLLWVVQAGYALFHIYLLHDLAKGNKKWVLNVPSMLQQEVLRCYRENPWITQYCFIELHKSLVIT